MSAAVALDGLHRTWCALWGERVDFCSCHDVDPERVIGWHVKSAARTSRISIFHGPDRVMGTLSKRLASAEGGRVTSRKTQPQHDDQDGQAGQQLDPADVIAWWVDQATHGTAGDSGREADGQD